VIGGFFMRAHLFQAIAGALSLAALQIFPVATSAEPYVGGHFGVALPQKNGSDTQVSTGALPADSSASNVSLQNSYSYGLRAGYFFERFNWFGVEGEALSMSPNLKQQIITVYPPGSTPPQQLNLRGESARVIMGAMNLVFRSVDERFKAEPYGALGLGIFSGRLHDGLTDESRSSTKPGANAKAGLRYKLTEHLRAFGEYRFNYVRFDFSQTANLPGLNTTMTIHTFAVGLEYAF
jgi:opacity protein-like surface antigen